MDSFITYSIKLNDSFGQEGIYSIYAGLKWTNGHYKWGPVCVYSGPWKSCVKFLKGMGW